MKKYRHFLLAALLILGMVLAGCAGQENAEQTQPESTPEPSQQTEPEDDRVAAPDFTVYDEAGNPVKLSDFQGKPVVLNFWASWCGPCKAEMPDFQETYDQLGDQVQFMIVDLTDGREETVEIASAYIASQGYTFPVFYDCDLEASTLYGIQSIPTTYFIDAEGYAVTMYNGSMSADILMEGISMILRTG